MSATPALLITRVSPKRFRRRNPENDRCSAYSKGFENRIRDRSTKIFAGLFAEKMSMRKV